MPTPRHAELRTAIQTYEKLLTNFRDARPRLQQRRQSAMDHVMVELDDRLAGNARTIEILERSIASLREHLELLDRDGHFPSSAC